MKSPRKSVICFFAIAISLPALLSPTASSATTAGIKSGSSKASYKILWRDEFDGKKVARPNEKYWDYDLGGGGWGNNENEFYTLTNAKTDCGGVQRVVGGKKKTVCTGNGSLVITANRMPYDSLEAQSCTNCTYFSARLKTQGKLGFKYGRMEARIKMPKGAGTWPAFWMLGKNISTVPWPTCGEIDIVEVGNDPYTSISTLHGPVNFGAGGISNGGYVHSSQLNQNYHIFRMDWLPTQIDFYMDKKLVYSISKSEVLNTYKGKWVYDKEFFLIMNLAMGGYFVGGPPDPSIRSTQMKIDYVRYYAIKQNGKTYGTLYKH